MDLDDFEIIAAPESPIVSPGRDLSTRQAIAAFDNTWLSQRSRGARWMDLIGDYAGMERFVIDGDALVQKVLEDPLLGLAKDNDLSFQLAHALHSLEKILDHFIQRRAIFDIVFWESNGLLTRSIGGDLHARAGASLARTLLARHLQQHLSKHVTVHVFSSLEDEAWASYVMQTKPMFVMTTDGGQEFDDEDELRLYAILFQRAFILKLLSTGITLSLLRDVEFRQLKIFAFVFSGRRESNPTTLLPKSVWAAISKVRSVVISESSSTSLRLENKNPETSEPSLDILLSSLVKAFVSDDSVNDLELALFSLFAAHCILLDGFVPLSLRGPSTMDVSLTSNVSDVLSRLLPRVYKTVNSLALKSGRLPALDIDVRFFRRLVGFALRGGKNLDTWTALAGPMVEKRIREIWAPQAVPSLSTLSSFHQTVTLQTFTSQSRGIASLLPFDNVVFNSVLGHLDVPTSANVSTTDISRARFSPGLVYNDVRHWHNQNTILPKHLGGDKKPASAEWLRQRALRKEQIFMARFQKFAESLAGATSSGLHQQVISSVSSSTRAGSLKRIDTSSSSDARSSRLNSPTSSRATSPFESRPGSPSIHEIGRVSAKQKGKAKPLTKKEALLQQIQAQKASTRLSDSQKWWVDQIAQIEALPLKSRVVHLRTLAGNKRVVGKDADAIISLEYRLYQIHLHIQTWLEHPSRSAWTDDRTIANVEVHDHFSVDILRQCLEAYKLPSHSSTTLAALDSVLISMGFQTYLPSLHATHQADIPERAMSFKFEKLLKASKSASPLYKWMRIPDKEPILWQLRVFGEHMERMFDSRPDNRVQFDPDAWQRNVLDSLDANHSILVVAPTSAGKTFISFYAMEQVLRESDDGILIYVAPTKALVNQIAADVHARFRKSRNGSNFWAIHSRDYRVNDPQNCQVLVTVPEILATMLLSPALARVWTPRIRRIIMDEIHTIGEQESGPVWEQILLLAPCPIIGLSATIGKPEEFNSWLESVQRAHGFQHTFIHHRHRYSHLRKHIYLFDGQVPASFSGLDNYRSTDRTRFLHPVTMIEWGTAEIPPDFALEAADTLTLYDAFLQKKYVLPRDVASNLLSLDPVRFFSQQSGKFLRQQDVLNYEAALIEALRPLISQHTSHPHHSTLRQILSCLKDSVLSEAERSRDLNIPPTAAEFRNNLINVVADLHVSGDLPAILFSFDRSYCEIMAQDICDRLEAAEVEWKASSPIWAQKLRDWQAWEAGAKERERAQQRLEKMKPKRGEERGAMDTSQRVPESSWESSFDPNEPVEQFSFSGGNAAYLRSELENDLHELSWSTPKWALRALQRGIAVHHAGMSKAYRSLVERLFRLKFVRIMIATGTLALGINAPARTTVFCGDSPFLTALMYRQCAGRAGRRGYDLLGKVIFYGLPIDRIGRLVMSRLPALTGNFPLSSTLVLRLCNLLEGSQQAPTAIRGISSVLRLPQIAYGSPIGHEQLLHIIRFSIDYLRRIHLLDGIGRPLNLFGIAGRLYYTEPSNLALVVLLQSGVIHDICSKGSALEAKRQLMIVMCHLFGRRYLPPTFVRRAKSSSLVFLPPLPREVEHVLTMHGNIILDTFVSYAQTYSTHNSVELGLGAGRLPLSGRSYTWDEKHHSQFIDEVRETSRPTLVRCPFAASSGHDDNFASVSDLTHSALNALHLDTQAIPSMDMLLSKSQNNHLNAYILDFYLHGQVDALVHDNAIRRGDVWYALDDFSLSLRTVQAVLIELFNAPQATQESVIAPPVTQPRPSKPKRTMSSWDDEDIQEAEHIQVVEEDTGPTVAPSASVLSASITPLDVSDDEESPVALGAKPPSMRADDWRVLQVMSDVVTEFDTAFKKMWA